MKPKIRRAKLFREGHPTIRETVAEDVKWLCVAYEVELGKPPPPQWTDHLSQSMGRFDLFWMIEDNNQRFDKGFGPVGFVYAQFDDWKLTPHVQWFQWSTMRNKLRGTVEWFMQMRRNKDVGVIVVHSSEENSKWFGKLSHTWLPLFAIGGRGRNYTPFGRPDGNEYLWYMKGKRGYGRVKRHIHGKDEKDIENKAQRSQV